MTNPDYRHYLLIIDRSGSMSGLKDEATEGVRQFIKEQAGLPGKATLSLYQFDQTFDQIHDFIPLDQATSYELIPRGLTALLDAIGYAVTDVGRELADMPEYMRPGKVMVVIVTDGEENSSQNWTLDRVRNLLTQQQDVYKWAITYLGANVDAFREAEKMGLSTNSAMGYRASSAGTQSAYGAASAAATRFSTGKTDFMEYTDTERTAAADQDTADDDSEPGKDGQ